MEFVGTLIFVFSILCIVASGTSLAGLAIGLTLTMLVYMGATVSGANYNPAVTLGLYLRKKMTGETAVWYVVSQILGAVVAFYLAKEVVTVGAAAVSADSVAVFVAELVFTFALVSTVLFTAATKASHGNSYFGLAIGLVVVAWALAVGGVSGGFFNPAVLIGVSLGGGISGSLVLILLSHAIAAVLAAWFHSFAVGNEK